jgi:hypothetical protein
MIWMLCFAYAHVQDLPRTADHAANRTIFTWHIDMDAVRRRVATELLQAVGNLRSRMEHECLLRSEVCIRSPCCSHTTVALKP